MKTAISIPDPIGQPAERLTSRPKKSRNQLSSKAVAELDTHHDPTTLTDQINAVCAEVDTRPDPFVAEAARRIRARTAW